MAKIISDLAKEAFAKGDYTIAVDLYKQCIQEKNHNSLDIFMGYGDALACAGHIELSFDAYAHIQQNFGYIVPLDRLHHLSLALLNSVTSSGVSSQQNRSHQSSASNQQSISVLNGSTIDPLCCALCEDILKCPVTAICGHTFCAECCYGQTVCKLCGKVLTFGDKFKQDVLVLRLVEKWWSPESNDRAITYIQRNSLDEALKSCNESLEKCPNNYQGLLLRSEVLYRLSHFKSSLSDADNALKSRPTSFKAYLRRAYALSSLGETEEALIAFCLSIWLNKKTSMFPQILPDIAKLIHQLLSSTRKSQFPMATPYTMRRRQKRRHSRKIVNDGSDCDEENSSCSEETNFSKIRTRRTIERRLKCSNTCNVINSVIIPIPNTRIRAVLDSIHEEIYKIQTEMDTSLSVLKVNPSLVEVTDFDCVLCYRTLWKPVVTPCGHTYCLVCLDRLLYYSSHCPLCKSSFKDEYSMNIVRNALSRKYVTKFIEIAMQQFIPGAYENRKLQEIEKEEFVPVFICTVSFPYVPCPLFVYESRYRLMIRRAIESGDRQFGIAHAQPHVCQRYSDYGTMLDIRDCVQLSDGRAILSTVGCRRFKVLDRDEKDGYDTAKVEYISDEKISRDRLQAVTKLHSSVFYKAVKWYDSLPQHTKEEILKSFGCMPTLERHWESVADGPAWAWYIIAILPLNQALKVDILATTKLEKRLLAIDKTLEHVAAQKRRSLSVDVMCEGVLTCQATDCCQRASSSTHLEDDIQQIT